MEYNASENSNYVL